MLDADRSPTTLDADWDAQAVDGPPPASATDDRSDHDAVSLVAVVVRNETPVPRRVRVRTTSDGPVLPPRRCGVPEAGWREDGFAGTVPAEGRLAVGFAAAGASEEPPVQVIDRGRADDGAGGDAPTPSQLVRDLGSPAPPRDAVPMGDVEAGNRTEPSDPADSDPTDTADQVPTHVSAWLDAVDDRIGRGETEPSDRAALRRVAGRAAALADACASGDQTGAQVSADGGPSPDGSPEP